MGKPGKRITALKKPLVEGETHPLTEAVKLVKKNATAKFDETIEIALNLGVDPKHADQMVRGVVSLPNGTGKTVRVGVFARGAKADEARAAGADVVGAEDLMETVQGGTIRVNGRNDMTKVGGLESEAQHTSADFCRQAAAPSRGRQELAQLDVSFRPRAGLERCVIHIGLSGRQWQQIRAANLVTAVEVGDAPDADGAARAPSRG